MEILSHASPMTTIAGVWKTQNVVDQDQAEFDDLVEEESNLSAIASGQFLKRDSLQDAIATPDIFGAVLLDFSVHLTGHPDQCVYIIHPITVMLSSDSHPSTSCLLSKNCCFELLGSNHSIATNTKESGEQGCKRLRAKPFSCRSWFPSHWVGPLQKLQHILHWHAFPGSMGIALLQRRILLPTSQKFRVGEILLGWHTAPPIIACSKWQTAVFSSWVLPPLAHKSKRTDADTGPKSGGCS